MYHSIVIIIVSILFFFSACTSPVQKSQPLEPSHLPLPAANLLLECFITSDKAAPFVELSLIIPSGNKRYFIATAYGSLHTLYQDAPSFAPRNTLCGAAIVTNEIIHYFFVIRKNLHDVIDIQSAVHGIHSAPHDIDYHTIMSIPFEYAGQVHPRVIVKTNK